MQNYGVDGPTRKPVIIGETGAFREAFASPAEAAAALQSWQAASCAYGIDGWLLWTWDTDEQRELWNAQSAGGTIATTLGAAVATRSVQGSSRLDEPRARQAGDRLRRRRGRGDERRGRERRHSLALGGRSSAVDRGRPAAAGHDRSRALVVAQYPAEGATTHRVWTKGPGAGDAYVLRETVAGTTRDGQILEVRAGVPWANIRYVRVETTQSPSWVAWREIQVLAAG